MVSQKSPPPLTFEEIKLNGWTLGHEYMTKEGDFDESELTFPKKSLSWLGGGGGVAKKPLMSTLIELNLYLKVLKKNYTSPT